MSPLLWGGFTLLAELSQVVLVSQVKQMISEGAPIKAVACASTGDTSAALAVYCAAAGIQSIVLLPKGKISIAQLVQPIANGALVLSLDTDFDGCMRVVQEITKDRAIYLANSMNSLRIEGQKTVGIEIVQQFDWQTPDVIIIPGGNLGNVSALGNGLIRMHTLGLIAKLPRIVVAQAERANPLYRSYLKNFETFEPIQARKTLASAIQIGNPVSAEKAIRILKQFDGIVEQATEQELSDAAALGAPTLMFFGHGVAMKYRGDQLARRGMTQPALMDSLREGESAEDVKQRLGKPAEERWSTRSRRSGSRPEMRGRRRT